MFQSMHMVMVLILVKNVRSRFLQVNIGNHPSKAVTLIHHIETVMGVPYRYNKLFRHKIRLTNKEYYDDFFQSVFF